MIDEILTKPIWQLTQDDLWVIDAVLHDEEFAEELGLLNTSTPIEKEKDQLEI